MTPLRIVASETTPEPSPPSLDYEWQHRQRVLRRDWSRVHCEADKRTPFASIVGRWR